MPSIEGLDPTLQTIGTLLFVVVVAIFSAWSLVFGKKPAKSETKEFSMMGQLSDMGPVRELVEQTGLLFQQQVKTTILLERLALAAEAALAAHAEEREEQDREEEIDRKAGILAEDIVRRREEERAHRRPSPRKPT